jgi:hypothetical protein
VLRSETVLGGFFLATWIAAGVYVAGWLAPPGLALSYYGYDSFAAAFGWVIGNLLVLRLRALGCPTGRRRAGLVAFYLALPAGLVALLRAMAPTELRRAAPLVGLLGLGIYTIFFLVPLTLRRKS